MQQHPSSLFTPFKLALAWLPLALGACGGSQQNSQSPSTVMAATMVSGEPQVLAPAETEADADAELSRARVYSVINLGSEAGASAMLNERGQAAFGTINAEGLSNGFFDGERIHDVGSLGGNYTWIRALNYHGVLAGESMDNSEPFGQFYAVTWAVAEGMRALPQSDSGSAYAINDKRQVAGYKPAPDITARAIRWEAKGGLTDLGPLPLSLSQAYAMNASGASAGFFDTPSGPIHASFWDSAGKLTDLGTLGGSNAFAQFINRRGEVAGVSDSPDKQSSIGFFWSARSGMVPIDVAGGGVNLVADLNSRGDVVGNADMAGTASAYLWSSQRGLKLLPRGGALRSGVADLNDRGEMVGYIDLPAGQAGGLRAVRWAGLNNPVDLNTQLYRAPAGLVVYAGAAINEKGVILAHSNAGLLLLRPGTHGSDAPVLGPLVGLPDEVEVQQQVQLKLGFVDNASGQTHKAVANWSDNCASPAPRVRESGGVGEVRLQHRFCASGFHALKLKITDSGGRSTELRREYIVNGAGVASIAGKGKLAAAPPASGSGLKPMPLQFALWVPMATDPAATVSLLGPFHFRSEQVATPLREGQLVRIEGKGRLNGRAGYRFLIEADAGGKQTAGGDRLRVRIVHSDPASGAELLDYDNAAPPQSAAMRGPAAPTVIVEGGLTLHDLERR